MDLANLIIPILLSYWYIVPLLMLVALVKSPWFKGVMGEWQVNLLLKYSLPRIDYCLIKNVTIPTEDGTTQIDHIVVSRFGIFVIETKNFRGWIFGSEHQKRWTQKIFKTSHTFQNPLHQNYKHVKTLEGLLGVSSECVFSVIVFIGNSTFKTPMPENVTYAGGCVRYIKSKTTEILEDSQVSAIITAIDEGRLARSFETHRTHVAHVQEIIQNKSDEQTCPKCGGAMKLRETQKGPNQGRQFWGCSSFPKCRGYVAIV